MTLSEAQAYCKKIGAVLPSMVTDLIHSVVGTLRTSHLPRIPSSDKTSLKKLSDLAICVNMRFVYFFVVGFPSIFFPLSSIATDLNSITQVEPFHCESILAGAAGVGELANDLKVENLEQLKRRQEVTDLSEGARNAFHAFFDGKSGYLIGVRGRSVGRVLNHAGRALPRSWADQQRKEANDASDFNDRTLANRKFLYNYGIPTVIAAASAITSALIAFSHPEPGSPSHQVGVGTAYLGAASLIWMMFVRLPYDTIREALRTPRDLATNSELPVDRLARSFNLPRVTDQMIEDFVSEDPFEKTFASLYTGPLSGKDYLITYGRKPNRVPFIVIAVRDAIVWPPAVEVDHVIALP